MVAWIRDRHAAAAYWPALARARLDAADQRGFAGEVARVPFESLVPAPESVPVNLVDHRYVLGGLGPAELIVLCRLARSAHPKTIFEFGTFLGATTLQLAANTAVSRIRQLYGNSQTYDFSEHAGKIDFVFVDASHRYQPAAKDTRTAPGLVAPGGLVVWHDYGYHAEGLRRVLDELSKTRRLRYIAGTSLVVYSADGDASPD